MLLFRTATARQVDVALLLLRVVTGLTMAAHGWQKVFGFGVTAVAGNFTNMGIPMASVAGPLVSFLELVGGIALALGLLTRVFSSLLAVDMLVASLLIHLPAGFFAPKGAELTLLLLTILVALTITGSGSFAVDSMFARDRTTLRR